MFRTTAFLILLVMLLQGQAFCQGKNQSVGLITGINYRPVFLPYFEYDYMEDFGQDAFFQPTIVSPVGGLFYNRDLNKRYGISVAAKYFTQTAVIDCRQCRFVDSPTSPLYYKSRSRFIEVPVNLAVNLNSNENTKVRTYFTFGYVFNHLLSLKHTNLENDEEKNFKGSEIYFERTTHAITGGFEFRYYKEKLLLAFSPYVQIPVKGRENTVEMRFIGLQLKVGRNYLINE